MIAPSEKAPAVLPVTLKTSHERADFQKSMLKSVELPAPLSTTSKDAPAATPKLPPTFTPLNSVPRPMTVSDFNTQTNRPVAVKFRSLAKVWSPGTSPPVPPLIRVPLRATVLEVDPLSKVSWAEPTAPAVAPDLMRTNATPPEAGKVAATPKFPPWAATSYWSDGAAVNWIGDDRPVPVTVICCAVPGWLTKATRLVAEVGSSTMEAVPEPVTVPLTATFLVVAPPPETVTFSGPTAPVGAVEAMRTQTFVAGSAPLAVTVAIPPKPAAAEVVETSKFAGAVTVRLPVRLEPLTWND